MDTKKIMATFAILMISLGIAGFAFAHWEDTLIITGTVNTAEQHCGVSVEVYFDNDNNKAEYGEVATATCTVKVLNGYDDAIEIDVLIDNVYPCLDIIFVVDIKNTGEVPVKLVEYTDVWVDEANVDPELIGEGWYDSDPCQIDPGDIFYYWWHYHVGNDAVQDETATFTLTAVLYNWNEVGTPCILEGVPCNPADFTGFYQACSAGP